MNDVLLNNAALRELALRGDERIADFGSGLGQFTRAMARNTRGAVIGIERDEAQLAKARELAAADDEAQLADFRHGDVLEIDLPPDHDLVHARFILEHVPDPARVVANMLRALRPGGRIILADDDHDVLRLWPEPPGFYGVWQAYMRSYDRNGTDPIVGRRLISLLHDAGARPVRSTWIFFGGNAGMATFPVLASNLIGVVRGAREAILRNALYDEETFDAAIAAAVEWSRRPDAAIWFAMCWAEGVKA